MLAEMSTAGSGVAEMMRCRVGRPKGKLMSIAFASFLAELLADAMMAVFRKAQMDDLLDLMEPLLLTLAVGEAGRVYRSSSAYSLAGSDMGRGDPFGPAC